MSYIQVPADQVKLVKGDRMICINNSFRKHWQRPGFQFHKYCECGCGALEILNTETGAISLYNSYDWEVRRYGKGLKLKRKKQRTFLARNPKNKPGKREAL